MEAVKVILQQMLDLIDDLRQDTEVYDHEIRSVKELIEEIVV